MFHHPTCGAQHATVRAARSCEAGQRSDSERTGKPVVTDTRNRHWEGRVSVPEGRYAIRETGLTNEINFYKVDRPEEGKWAGWVFVKQIVGPDEYPVKGARKSAVLAAIGADMKDAMLLYGQEIGSCGRCGKRITNDESRAYGVGPDCRAILGW